MKPNKPIKIDVTEDLQNAGYIPHYSEPSKIFNINLIIAILLLLPSTVLLELHGWDKLLEMMVFIGGVFLGRCF